MGEFGGSERNSENAALSKWPGVPGPQPAEPLEEGAGEWRQSFAGWLFVRLSSASPGERTYAVGCGLPCGGSVFP